MNLSGYLIVRKGKNWNGNSARFVKTKPSVDFNEIAIRIECEIPDQLFTRPQLQFKIVIPKEAVPEKVIDAQVIGNVKDLIEQNLGIEIKLIAPEQI